MLDGGSKGLILPLRNLRRSTLKSTSESSARFEADSCIKGQWHESLGEVNAFAVLLVRIPFFVMGLLKASSKKKALCSKIARAE